MEQGAAIILSNRAVLHERGCGGRAPFWGGGLRGGQVGGSSPPLLPHWCLVFKGAKGAKENFGHKLTGTRENF